MKNKLVLLVAAVAAVVTVPAMASGGPDLSAVSANINFESVTTAILGVAALLATVHLAVRGAKMLLSMMKS